MGVYLTNNSCKGPKGHKGQTTTITVLVCPLVPYFWGEA